MKKSIVINMPQMAVEALSENWLFKELGDRHWELICDGLNTKSFDLKNDTGERLYATFVRIKIEVDKSLKSFRENQGATLDGSIKRFGDSMYFSDIAMSTETGKVKATLMTTFSIRDKVDNTSLSKAEPDLEENKVENLSKFPLFGNEYRLVKKKVLKELESQSGKFKIEEGEPIYSADYQFNPYYDINGVNLLYFAAYPIINDACECRYFNSLKPIVRWEQEYHTSYKDVFYYSNCNLSDSVVYQLMSSEQIDDYNIKNSSILRRKSDNAILARIFSIKTRNSNS